MLPVGSPAPEVLLNDLNGQSLALTDALKNGPVLLAFFKISCPTCQLTFPYLQRLADSAAGDAPQLIAISQDDASSTRQFQNRLGVSMRTLLDEARTFPASNAFRITSVPSLFLIEENGTISLAVDGFNKAVLNKLGERFQAAPFREGDSVPELRPG